MDPPWSVSDRPPERILTFHAGGVNDLALCPRASLVASCADDNRLLVTEYSTHTILAEYVAPLWSPPSAIYWAAPELDAQTTTLYVGYDNGIVRALALALRKVRSSSATPATTPIQQEENESAARVSTSSRASSDSDSDMYEIVLLHMVRPCSDRVVSIVWSAVSKSLVCGCRDGSVFFLRVDQPKMAPVPLGFVQAPECVLGVHLFEPSHPLFSRRRRTVIVRCARGVVAELTEPNWETIDTSRSYRVDSGVRVRACRIRPIKRRLREEERARWGVEPDEQPPVRPSERVRGRGQPKADEEADELSHLNESFVDELSESR